MGVQPDVLVDNNPRPTYDGKDTQLETAISLLKQWLKEEPVVVPTAPAKKRDMSYDSESCTASP
jgi:tricorn protease